ncbi:MAG TPA: transglutaminase family protein [Kofleriaceae bacterium]|nr:transglutaminase family protein [Kofleriaceae bacterium]
MRVVVQHRSRYVYPRAALLGPQTIRLRPADHTRARVESYALTIAPEHRVHWQRDAHGNHVARVTFKAGQTTAELSLGVELALDISPMNPFDFLVDDRAKQVPFAYPDGNELASFLDLSDPAYRMGRLATNLLKELPARGDLVGMLVAIVGAVRARVAYVIRDESGIWTPEETLANGRGSCRDSAALLVALLRARGIAARFASGYLVQLADEGMLPDEPRGVSRDVVDLHAWAEAYVPGAGWIGLDGTSGLFVGEGHVPLACAATPSHAAPLDGTSDVAAASVEFSATIGRIGHEPRPTTPYTEDVWRELLAAGDRADDVLRAASLELTVGGEPTYVVRGDDQRADEWSIGALGPSKWKRGVELARRLRDRLATGGVILHRTGKQYPGESLPRWALDIISRRDRTALWPAREATAIPDARGFGEALANALGVPADLHAAFEDPWNAIATEATLPPEIEPSRADDREERRRLAHLLDRGLATPAGFVLPLARVDRAWRTDRWTLRRGQLFLLAGDSPIGLRLPLASLVDAPPQPEWADAPKLPDPRQQAIETATTPPAMPAHIRTALALEIRDGVLWVFVPPLPRFAEFCELVHAIDRARAATGMACELEGYPPPPSRDAFKFAVTPDPGVLEVNVPPVASCREAAELHQAVFDEALASGLTAERYLLDGRAAGSGGGNHITLGGPTPERSPWLARPDLLASLVTFAQHHPSLAYMFTGLFVGPTSQAPRVDEARHDALYELELALPRLFADPVPPAWQVDQLLRNLLVDVAGSTHRAEISIDKLFDPGTPFGRQGLVELRAFEMPPHPRMAAAQVVLARAMVAAFTHAPYQHPLARWGSELHDRFLLPYFMWRDFEDALDLLARNHVALPSDAYAPFAVLRCPLIGTLNVGDARVELRNALEPWHVLGEQATQTGTARYVDSSMERIELRTHGLDLERYAIAIGGAFVPLRATAERELHVAGVRFRAWAPPHALHPHLGIHHPLRIDVIDTWAKRGVTAGAYHVWHPEGRAFDAPPLTRVEAAARRAQRFTLEGPPAWPIRARKIAPHVEQPYTLDLRRIDPGLPMPDPDDWRVDE